MFDIDQTISTLITHPDITKRPPSGKGEYKAWCPWHDDHLTGNPSLRINTEKKLVKCFSSRCNEGGVVNLARTWKLLPPKATQNRPQQHAPQPIAPSDGSITATYDYHDHHSNVLFQVIRRHPKTFVQRRPHPKSTPHWVQWIWDMKTIAPVIYRLPDVLNASPDEWIWIVEGEKDADRLANLNIVATTNPMGAGKWRPEYTNSLTGRKIAIIPDKDFAGMQHAINILTSVIPVATTAYIIDLPGLPEKGDVSDWLQQGHDAQDLLDLLNQLDKGRSREKPTAQGNTTMLQTRPHNLPDKTWGIRVNPDNYEIPSPGQTVTVTDSKGNAWNADLVALVNSDQNIWTVTNDTRASHAKPQPSTAKPKVDLQCPRCKRQLTVTVH